MLLNVGTDDGIIVLEVAPHSDRAQPRSSGLHGMAVRAIAPHPSLPGVLFVGTDGGLFQSRDIGRSWEPIVGWPANRPCWALAYHPLDPDRLLAGSQPAALFWSNDAGRTWDEITAIQALPGRTRWTFPHPPHQAHVTSLAFDPTDPDAIFASIEVGGILRSLDGGASWEQLDGQLDPDVHVVQPWLSMPSIVLAATGGGVFRSQDRGATWSGVGGGLGGYAVALTIQLAPPYATMVATRGGPTVLARTVDGGASWEPIQAELPQPRFGVQALVVSSANPDFVVYGAEDRTDPAIGRLWHSDDSGRHWRQIDMALAGLIYRLAFGT